MTFRASLYALLSVTTVYPPTVGVVSPTTVGLVPPTKVGVGL